MPDGAAYEVKNLLTYNNVKLQKSNKKSTKYLTFGMSLAPHTMSGHNVCASSTPGCRAACIVTSGFATMFKHVNIGRIARTRLFFQNRPAFKEMLFEELRKLVKFAKKKNRKLAVRLNVFSDIMWEKIFPDLFTEFKEIQFYDYTKHTARMLTFLSKKFPKNYHLTFSRSENNDKDCEKVLDKRGSVAAVYHISRQKWNGGLRPTKLYNTKVVNGDETDLRFLDPKGKIIGLYAKGLGRKDTSGFVIPLQMVA